MPPKRKSSSSSLPGSGNTKYRKGSRSSVTSSKKTSSSPSHPAPEPASQSPNSVQQGYTHDPHADYETAIGSVVDYFQRLCDESVKTTPPSFFGDLRSVAETLTRISFDANGELRDLLPQRTLGAYNAWCACFVSVWRARARAILEQRFRSLRQALRSGHISFNTENTFHDFEADIAALAVVQPADPAPLDQITDASAFLSPEESFDALQQLQLHYHEFQYKTYNCQEDSKLWLLIWRSLKLIFFVYQDGGFQFPRIIRTLDLPVENRFFGDELVRRRFQIAMPELGYQSAEEAEALVAHYCHVFRVAYEHSTPRPRSLGRLVDSKLSSSEESMLSACLRRKQVRPRLIHLLQRAALRYASIRELDLHWCRTSVDKLALPFQTTQSGVTISQNQGAADEVHLSGQDMKSAFDYVHYPFPETRAHEVAASEQITREMSEPGIFSDGPRVQYVVNRPPRHAQSPNRISSWTSFVARGPVGFTLALAKAFCRSWFARRRPGAKPRASLTPRPDGKKRFSQLSPVKDSVRRVSKASIVSSVPRLRGGGPKSSHDQIRTPGSPSRPEISPLSGNKSPLRRKSGSTGSGSRASGSKTSPGSALITVEDHVDDQLQDDSPGGRPSAVAERDRRLSLFRKKLGSREAPKFWNDRYIHNFLEPNDWDVDAAVEAYIENRTARYRSRNVENAWRKSATSPTPKQKTPPPAFFYDPNPDPALKPRSPPRASPVPHPQAIKDVAPRPGMLEDSFDDSSSSSTTTTTTTNSGEDQHHESKPDQMGDSKPDQRDDFSDISSDFNDPSLLDAKENVLPSQLRSNQKTEPLDPEATDEESGLSAGDHDDDDDLPSNEDELDGLDVAAQEDDETESNGETLASDKENHTPRHAAGEVRGRIPSHPQFDVFNDAIGDVEDGFPPSASLEGDTLFIRRHSNRPTGPRASKREPEAEAEGQTQPMANTRQPLGTLGEYEATEDSSSEASGNPGGERRPLGVLEEQEPTPSSAGITSSGDDELVEDDCHPCPKYVGQFHHVCHCFNSPVGMAQGNGYSPRNIPRRRSPSAPRSDRQLIPHGLPDLNDGSSPSGPQGPAQTYDPFVASELPSAQQSRFEKQLRHRGKGLPGRNTASPSSSERQRREDSARQNQLEELWAAGLASGSSSSDSAPSQGELKMKRGVKIKAERGSSGRTPVKVMQESSRGTSRSGHRSSGSRKSASARIVRAEARSPRHSSRSTSSRSAGRAPISEAEYLRTMFADEMVDELRYRGIQAAPNTRRDRLAQMLHETDLSGNLGQGNAYSYRMITNDFVGRARPRGWKKPPRIHG